MVRAGAVFKHFVGSFILSQEGSMTQTIFTSLSGIKWALLAASVLASCGCTVQVKPQVLPNVRWPWQSPPPPPKPWWQPGIKFITLRKPAVVEQKPEATPTPPAKPTAAIHGSGRNQYIVRNGRKHYWNGKHGADARWVASYRSCGAGGCSTRVSAIKPGE